MLRTCGQKITLSVSVTDDSLVEMSFAVLYTFQGLVMLANQFGN